MNEALKRSAVWWDAGGSEEVAERGRLVVDAGDKSVGIFRIDGALVAYENRCPHMGGPVCQGLMVARIEEVLGDKKVMLETRFDEEHPHIACPWHGFEFDLRTGEHAGGAGLAKLRVVSVKEEAGRIYILA